MNRPERLALVDHDDPALPVVAQCRLLKVARSTLSRMNRNSKRSNLSRS